MHLKMSSGKWRPSCLGLNVLRFIWIVLNAGCIPLSISSWWRHQMETFSALLAVCEGNHRSPVDPPHKGRWRGALMSSLICTWTNGWVNNREAGNLRRRRTHYDVTVMWLDFVCCVFNWFLRIPWGRYARDHARPITRAFFYYMV